MQIKFCQSVDNKNDRMRIEQTNLGYRCRALHLRAISRRDVPSNLSTSNISYSFHSLRCDLRRPAIVMVVAVLAVARLPAAQASSSSSSSASSAATSLSADSRCSVDNGMLADESLCRGFVVCQKGKARAMQCGQDLLFNRARLTCDLPSNISCDSRPKDLESGTCYTVLIHVTMTIRNQIRSPLFEVSLKVRAPRQPLRYFLLMAAGLDLRFRYETDYFNGYGDFVSAINGLHNDVTNSLAVWRLHTKNGHFINYSVDDYMPEDGSEIIYIYTDALG